MDAGLTNDIATLVVAHAGAVAALAFALAVMRIATGLTDPWVAGAAALGAWGLAEWGWAGVALAAGAGAAATAASAGIARRRGTRAMTLRVAVSSAATLAVLWAASGADPVPAAPVGALSPALAVLAVSPFARRLGARIRFASEEPEIAKVFGIRPVPLIWCLVAASGALAAWAGAGAAAGAAVAGLPPLWAAVLVLAALPAAGLRGSLATVLAAGAALGASGGLAVAQFGTSGAAAFAALGALIWLGGVAWRS